MPAPNEQIEYSQEELAEISRIGDVISQPLSADIEIPESADSTPSVPEEEEGDYDMDVDGVSEEDLESKEMDSGEDLGETPGPASDDEFEDISDLIHDVEESPPGEDLRDITDEIVDISSDEELPPVDHFEDDFEPVDKPTKKKGDSPFDELQALTSEEPPSVDIQEYADNEFVDSVSEIDSFPEMSAGEEIPDFQTDGIGDLSSQDFEAAASVRDEVNLGKDMDVDIPDLSDVSLVETGAIPDAVESDVPDINLDDFASSSDEVSAPHVDDVIPSDDFDLGDLNGIDGFDDKKSSGKKTAKVDDFGPEMSFDEIADEKPTPASAPAKASKSAARLDSGDDSFTIEPLDDGDHAYEDSKSSAGRKVSSGDSLELNDSDMRNIKKAIILFNPGLRNAIKDIVLNERLSPEDTRSLVAMILGRRSEETIHSFLEKKLGERISLTSEGAVSGRRVITARPEYSREGRERQKRLIRATRTFGGAAIVIILLSAVLFQMIYKPIMAKRMIVKGSAIIRESGDYVKKPRDYEKAENIFRGVETDYKKNFLFGYNSYARAYFDKKEYSVALEKLNRAYTINRTDIDTLNNLGYFYSKVPAAFYDSIVSSTDMWYFSKVEPEGEKKKKQITDRLTELILGEETGEGKYRTVREKGGERSQLELAIHFYKRVLLLDSRNVTAIDGIGNAYYSQGQFLKAKKYYEQIIHVDPKSIEGFSGLINLYIERDSFAEMATMHASVKERGLEKNIPSPLLAKMAGYYLSKKSSDDVNVRIDFGVESPRLKDVEDNPYPAVISVLMALNERDPYYPPLHIQWAKLNQAQQDFKSMKIHLEKAIQLEPNYFGALTLMGELYYDTKEPVKAYQYLNKALNAIDSPPSFSQEDFYKETEKIGKTYAMLGNIFYYFFDKVKYRYGDIEDEDTEEEIDKLANYNIARDKYEMAVTENYESPEVYYNLGRIYYMNKLYEKALDQWMNLYKDFVEHPELMFSLGNVFYHLGNYSASKGEYLKLISAYENEGEKIRVADPDNVKHEKIFRSLSSAYNNLGAIYQMQNNENKSSINYWKSIDYAKRLDRENEFARVNLARSFGRNRETKPILDDNIPYALDVYREDMRK